MPAAIRIKRCTNRYEVELARAILAINGMQAMVAVDNHAGLPIPVTDGVELLVLEDDVERARDVLATWTAN